MTVIIFILLLAVLIFVHELGHFLAAKAAGIRVDEFGIGFPPRLFSWQPKGSETRYSLNLIPFGGFVKIYGEDAADVAPDDPDRGRALASKSKFVQAWVLAAGVIFNAVFAWLLISLGFMSGLPTSVSETTRGVVGEPAVTIISVMPGSPAETAGLKPGDEFADFNSVEAAQHYIGSQPGKELVIRYERGEEIFETAVVPRDGIVEGRGAIGVGLDRIGIVRLPLHLALWEGGTTTLALLKNITIGLGEFLWNAVRGAADLSQVAGPVGIVGLVGDAAEQGLAMLVSFAAFISLNLAVINLLPFPALDGGRILFVVIEAVRRKPISPKLSSRLNTLGFLLLLLLMAALTVHDIAKLFAS